MKSTTIKITGVLVLLIALWWVWPRQSPAPDGGDSPVGTRSPGSSARPGGAAPGHAAAPSPDALRAGHRRSSEPRERAPDGPLGAQDEAALERIDELLRNENLEHSEVAAELKTLATSPRLSPDVRSEALAHGLLLDPAVMAGLSGEPGLLSEDMARQLLDQIINFNERPSVQIQVYQDLIRHPSTEIRDIATEMLAFMVADDAEEMELLQRDLIKLLALADQKRQQSLREESLPEPGPLPLE